MGNVRMDTKTAEAAIGNILNDLSDTAEAVICEANAEMTKMIKNKSVGHYISKLIKQWKFGEKLTNPLVTFTKELKTGHYDELQENEIDLLHQAALDLSVLWRSEPEINMETIKSNLGYLLVQETIIRIAGNMKAGDYDIKTLFSILAWYEKL